MEGKQATYNYFKASDTDFIPTTPLFHDITKQIPNVISFVGDFYVEKIFEKYKNSKFSILNERYTVDEFGLEVIDSIFIKISENIFLSIFCGSADDAEVPKSLIEIRKKLNLYSFDKKKIITNGIANVAILFKDGFKKETEKHLRNILPCKVEHKKTNSISIVCQKNGSLYTEEFLIKKPQLNLEMNYGKSFINIHETIIKRLDTPFDKGIVLLHGLPGTGKSYYLRFLVNSIKDKDVIYIPPDLANEIASPSFIPFLMKYPNSVFLIEDAENILKKRIGQNNQAVSNILNLSDGLLSDCLSIQIIATFNCQLTDIDEALLRKGRLIAKHEFGKLPLDECQKISDFLGFKTKIIEEITLAEIYNQEEENFNKTNRNKLGF